MDFSSPFDMQIAEVLNARGGVNDGLKLVENQRYEIDGLSGLSGEICERISPSIFWWQTTSGGNSLSRPQPPEAVAEGQSLQGIASRPSSATEIDIRRGHRHDCVSADNACTCKPRRDKSLRNDEFQIGGF